MTRDFMASQFARLINRFGQKAFNDEFVILASREIYGMSEGAFITFVDVMIGSRPHTKPPLLSEFREARMAEEKRKLENDVRSAVREFEHPSARGGLKKFLAMNYPGCKTLWEAVEVERLKIRIAKADKEYR